MNHRTKKILSMTQAGNIPSYSYNYLDGYNQDKGKENSIPKKEIKIDEKSIWLEQISLNDMEKIKTQKFEHLNSYEYVRKNEISFFEMTVSTNLPRNTLGALMPVSEQSAQPSSEPVQLTELTQSNLKLTPPTMSIENILCNEEFLPPSEDIVQHSLSPPISSLASQQLQTPFFEDSDDSVKDKDYVPPSSSTDSPTILDQILKDTIAENVEASTSNLPTTEKKKRKLSSAKEKQAKKHKKNLEKYSIKPPCHNLCKKICTFNFTDDQRLGIHADYWSMDWEQRGIFIKGLVDVEDCVSKSKNFKRKRTVTHKYHLMLQDRKIEVCKTFFLCTLGYDKKNDRRVLSALKKSISNQKDKRDGRNLKHEKIDRDILTQHINSFNPCVHHYRTKHAPNKKYLPSDLTITMMHEDFKKTYPDMKCSFETYRNHVTNTMNISFSQLGHEECELCEKFNLHNYDHAKKERDPNCDDCIKYIKHNEKYVKARKKYNEDVTRVPDEENVFVSADMQKVIMLPRIDVFKCVVFCPRIVAYHETFAPLGKFTSSNPVYSVIWHEAVSGRNQEDLVSTFRAFLLSKRDAKSITIWVDNCSAQNKNWCLMTFLISIINSIEIAATKIILRYFEPGHTYMSADSFHHRVEQSLQKKKKVYDFKDFSEVVETAVPGKVNIKQMDVSDFFLFKSHISQQKTKDEKGSKILLREIVEVMVERGKYFLYFKTDFDQEQYGQMSCLKSKKILPPDVKSSPKGVSLNRKQEIIKKLGELMPKNRLSFWKNLPTSADSESTGDRRNNFEPEFDVDLLE